MLTPTLRVFSGDPSIEDRQRGFTAFPKWIDALPDLHATGKAVLRGLVGHCRTGERTCTVSIARLAQATGLRPSVVKHWLPRLVDEGFILRRLDESRKGESWETLLLFDPRGLEDTRPTRSPTPANQLADPGQSVSRPRLMDSPTCKDLIQKSFTFPESSPDPLASLPRTDPEEPFHPPVEATRPAPAPYSQGSPRPSACGAARMERQLSRRLPWNQNPPAPKPKEIAPSVENIREALEIASDRGSHPVAVKAAVTWLCDWIGRGVIAADVLDRLPDEVKKTAGCGPPVESHPQPAGVLMTEPAT